MDAIPANESPWAKSEWQHDQFLSDGSTDAVVIGGGIAGIATAYYILSQTNKNVVLVEQNKLCSGATGHNAGQAINGFECGYFDIYQKYGLQNTIAAYEACEFGKSELLRLNETHRLNCPIQYSPTIITFHVYEDFLKSVQKQQIVNELLNIKLLHFTTSEKAAYIPEESKKHVRFLNPDDWEKYRTKYQLPNEMVGILVDFDSLLLDSSRFALSLVQYMKSAWAARFQCFEHSAVTQIDAEKPYKLHINGYILRARDVVLATNAYSLPAAPFKPPRLSVVRETLYAELVDYQRTMTVIGSETGPHYPYYNYRLWQQNKSLLVSNRAQNLSEIDYHYNGILGYSESGIRIVDEDKHFKNVYYNLGCNGIGLLLAIYGGMRVTEMMRGNYTPNLFNGVGAGEE